MSSILCNYLLVKILIVRIDAKEGKRQHIRDNLSRHNLSEDSSNLQSLHNNDDRIGIQIETQSKLRWKCNHQSHPIKEQLWYFPTMLLIWLCWFRCTTIGTLQGQISENKSSTSSGSRPPPSTTLLLSTQLFIVSYLTTFNSYPFPSAVQATFLPATISIANEILSWRNTYYRLCHFHCITIPVELNVEMKWRLMSFSSTKWCG